MNTGSITRGFGLVLLLGGLAASNTSCGGGSGPRALTSEFDGGLRDSSSENSSSGGTGDDGSALAGDGSTGILADDGGGCIPMACGGPSFDCGLNEDGCGNVLDCGGCAAPAICGGGGFNKCGTGLPATDAGGDGGAAGDGGAPVCVPATCASAHYDCGGNGDGCGGALDCGSCVAPAVCGLGGFSKCGAPDSGTVGGGVSCNPTTCTALGYNCGPAPDGCGGLLQCGPCTVPETCGGAGSFSQCGLPPGVMADGGRAPLCTPTTCSVLGYTCGSASDGCGGLLDCGTCAAPEQCGLGGFDKCGLPPGIGPDGGSTVVCTPATCTSLGYTCGYASNGCGGLLQCGLCAAPDTCGGAGGFDQCGLPPGTLADGGTVQCVPLGCADQNITCGPAGDGCGNVQQCGTCTGSQTCGGGGVAGQCGCTGLCSQQVVCDGGLQTSLSGTVRAPLSAWVGPAVTPDPVPNALVYIPNIPSAVQPFTPGAACRQCGSDVSGNPLVYTYTNFDGTFTLSNVPVGSQIPIVVQLGRWRREFYVNVSSCTTVALPTDLNLPSNKTEGDIPLTAISTGSVDPLECVLLKMGVDQAEFTSDNGTGRIHIYGGGPSPTNGAPGVTVNAATRPENALLNTSEAGTGTFMNYDQIMLPCWGSPETKNATELANLIAYADSGGHFFATHYSYSWLATNGEFKNVAKWHPDYNNPGSVEWTLNVSTSVPPSPPAANGAVFAPWLNLVGALSNAGTPMPANPQVQISNPRHDVDAVEGRSLDWIDGTDPNHKNALVEHFTFDTPVAAADGGVGTQCGHAIFSDFHVSNFNGGASTYGMTFPNECPTTPLTAQERVLEYMIFDLASCVGPSSVTCTPLTCASQKIGCGPAGDGCGGLLDCGACTAPLTCGGGGVHGQCGEPPDGGCTALSCVAQGLQCGQGGDGCGNVLDCGTCTAPAVCTGNVCTVPDAGPGCVATGCAAQGLSCGQTGDGCGNVLDCGSCMSPAVCVGGQCVTQDAGTCMPATCTSQNLLCGMAGDGCGGALQCGVCAENASCVAGRCITVDAGVAVGCTPLGCTQQNLACGAAGNGCGGQLDCGPCTSPAVCVAGQCVSPPDAGTATCTPITCEALGYNCGATGDGCGNLLQCGTCAGSQTCGGGGQANKCGSVK